MTCCIHKVRYENGFESLRIVRVTDSYDRLRKSLSTKRRLTTGSQRDIDFIFTYLCSIRNYIRIHIYTIFNFFMKSLGCRPHFWRKKSIDSFTEPQHHLTPNLPIQWNEHFWNPPTQNFQLELSSKCVGALRIQMLFNDII